MRNMHQKVLGLHERYDHLKLEETCTALPFSRLAIATRLRSLKLTLYEQVYSI